MPDRKGFNVFAGGFAGIKVSRFTKEAAVGSRKDSGVRHVRGARSFRLSLRRVRSNISGLPSSRPFTFSGPPSMASSNRSPSNSKKRDVFDTLCVVYTKQKEAVKIRRIMYPRGFQFVEKVSCGHSSLMVPRRDRLPRTLWMHRNPVLFIYCDIFVFSPAAWLHVHTHLCWQGRPILCLRHSHWRHFSVGSSRGRLGAPMVEADWWRLAAPSKEDLLLKCACCPL